MSVKVIRVSNCISCDFEQTTMDGPECSHPDFKQGYLSMTFEQRQAGVHKNCPLKQGDYKISYKLRSK